MKDQPALIAPGRRSFLGNTGILTLSAAAITLLAGQENLPPPPPPAASRTSTFSMSRSASNTKPSTPTSSARRADCCRQPVLDVAVQFQGHHKSHRDALIATIEKLGGKPVAEKKLDDYARALKADTLKSQKDVLDLAARLELGATNAYLGVIPSFKDNALSKVAARLAADETMHWTVLSNALGRPLPPMALSFGA